MESLKKFFEKFQSVMEQKIVPVASKIAAQKHLAALRDGLTILIPFTVIGGISLMIANPPVDTSNYATYKYLFQIYACLERLGNELEFIIDNSF